MYSKITLLSIVFFNLSSMDFKEKIDFQEEHDLKDYVQLVVTNREEYVKVNKIFGDKNRTISLMKIDKIDDKDLKQRNCKIYCYPYKQIYTLSKNKYIEYLVTYYLFQVENIRTTFVAKFYNYIDPEKRDIKSISVSKDLKYFKIEIPDFEPLYYENQVFDFEKQADYIQEDYIN